MHSAASLFEKNIESAEHCLTLFDAISKLAPKGIDLDWILRASVVFVVSALDTYFHDKVKYRVGKYSLEDLPKALAKFEIRISDISTWERAERKGNVLRNWVTDHFSTKPLQSPQRIAEALKFAGIEDVWREIEKDDGERRELIGRFDALIRRRNQIAHEGDREQSRKSGKKVRGITRDYVSGSIDYAKNIVGRIEAAFPA